MATGLSAIFLRNFQYPVSGAKRPDVLEGQRMTTVATWRGRTALVTILAIAALGLAMVLATAPLSRAQSSGVEIKQFALTPGEEVPPVTANAAGYFSGTLGVDSLTFDLSAVTDDITMAHIHAGAKGANGPVVAFLFGPSDPAVDAIHPVGTIRVANLVGPHAGNWKAFTDAMAKGELYVNVHSTANPAGVVRGQIPATKAPAPLPPATGSTLETANDSGGTQTAGILLIAAATGLFVLVVGRRTVR